MLHIGRCLRWVLIMEQRSQVDFALQQQKKSLLGRLQWRWFSEFHDAESLPDEAQIRRRLLESHRENPSYGAFLEKLIGCRVTTVRKLTEMEFGFDIPDLLDRLEHSPWSTARFLEIQGLPSPFSECEGIFIYQEKLRNQGRVYVITFFDQASFPEVGRMELRACKSEPEPFLSVLTTSGYRNHTLESLLNDSDEIDPQIKVALLSLQCLDAEKPYMSKALDHASASDTQESPLFPPPEDALCERLLDGVNLNEVCCTKLEVPLGDIEPANYDYALLYPAGLIKPLIQELKAGSKAEILVYWNGSAFVMSDDYAAYLAVRALGLPHVTVVVMGDYPEDVYGKGQKGGKELLPALGYQYCSSPGRDKETRLRILDARLRRELGPSASDRLYDFIFKFHRRLHNPLTLEKELHQLILHGAKIFNSTTSTRIHTEVRLGHQYRADLVIQSHQENRGILLVELKRANLPLFTKSGAPYAYVTRALQQVEDWMRFWHEHPSSVPAPLDPTISPTGIVIIGRSKFLTEDDKRRLMSLNSNRRIQLLTYDDVLARVEDYVAMMA